MPLKAHQKFCPSYSTESVEQITCGSLYAALFLIRPQTDATAMSCFQIHLHEDFFAPAHLKKTVKDLPGHYQAVCLLYLAPNYLSARFMILVI